MNARRSKNGWGWPGSRPWAWLFVPVVLCVVAPVLWTGRLSRDWLIWAAVCLAAEFALLLPGAVGPVFYYDLVRSARSGRHIAFRVLYALALLVILFIVYQSWFGGPFDWFDPQAWLESGSIASSQMARFATSFFGSFLGAQFAVILLFTPAYAASALAEERERKTLPFLLTTDLSDREIVLGTLAARLGHMLLLLLTGLPVVGMLQLLGGVDPFLVLAGFAATGLTMLSLGSASVLVGIHARRPLEAVLRTYVYVAVFLVLSGCIPGVALGNPFWAVAELREVWATSGVGTGTTPTDVLASYAVVHLIIAILCLLWAIQRLRPSVLEQDDLPPLPRDLLPIVLSLEKEKPLPPEAFLPMRHRPPVGEAPLLWKEMHLEQQFEWERLHPIVAIVVLFLVVSTGSVGMTILLVGLAAESRVAEGMNVWVRVVGTAVACLTFVIAAFYAAGTISRERERQTLDSLRLLPEGPEPILKAKWIGTVLSTRQCWWCLIAVWVAGVLSGGLNILSAPLLVLGWAVYTGFVASVGLYFSTLSQSTLRATLLTLLALVGVSGGQLLLWNNSEAYRQRLAEWHLAWLPTFQLYGLVPPMPLVVLACSYPEFYPDALATMDKVLSAVAGLACYAVAAWVFWKMAVWRFRALNR